MQSRLPLLASAVVLALGTSVAAAGIDDMFSIRGYGTVGGMYSTHDEGDYVHDMYAQKEGVGHSHSVTAAIDSRTALQVDARFTDRFFGVVQVVSEAVYNNSWDNKPQKLWEPSLEWANLNYRVTDTFTVRVGRIVMPFLMNADVQKVGYAQHWMRTPSELYGKTPFSSVDGGDINFNHYFGSVSNSIRAYYGTQEVRRPQPLPSADLDIYGVIDTVEVGALTLRASYVHGVKETLETDPVLQTQFTSLASTFSAAHATDAAAAFRRLTDATTAGHEDQVHRFGFGAGYDVGQWFAMGEIFKADGARTSARFTSAYVSGGVRINKWTPYATYALTDSKRWGGFVPTAALQGQLLQVANGVNTKLEHFGDYSQDQSTASIGVRWDAMRNVALKAQYDYVNLPSGSTGMFVNRTAEFKPGQEASLFGLSVDFLF